MSSYLTSQYFDLLQYKQPCQTVAIQLTPQRPSIHALLLLHCSTCVASVIHASLAFRNIYNPVESVKAIEKMSTFVWLHTFCAFVFISVLICNICSESMALKLNVVLEGKVVLCLCRTIFAGCCCKEEEGSCVIKENRLMHLLRNKD